MAMVKALVDCFVDNGLRKAGEEFRYSGPALPDVLEFMDGGPVLDAAEPERKLRPGRKPKAEATPN
jgi:hypothetical protein